MKNIINIPNHCPKKVNYCTFIEVKKSQCSHCTPDYIKLQIYNHEHHYCDKCMFEELTKHNYKNETE
jgi:hypothetical protein